MNEKQKNALADPNIELFLLPTPKMQQMIAKNDHPIIQALPSKIKGNFLAGYGILLETKMVIDYLENKLDEKNKFILDLGEIRVFGAEEVIIKNIEKSRIS